MLLLVVFSFDARSASETGNWIREGAQAKMGKAAATATPTAARNPPRLARGLRECAPGAGSAALEDGLALFGEGARSLARVLTGEDGLADLELARQALLLGQALGLAQ